MKLFSINRNALKHYRNTRGNENITKNEAQRKLTRNILLALEVEPTKFENKQLYMYGRLWITTVGDTIVKISNHNKIPLSWKKDHEKYTALNKELGIVE